MFPVVRNMTLLVNERRQVPGPFGGLAQMVNDPGLGHKINLPARLHAPPAEIRVLKIEFEILVEPADVCIGLTANHQTRATNKGDAARFPLKIPDQLLFEYRRADLGRCEIALDKLFAEE